MKPTNEQIRQVDQKLIALGFGFIDMRIEVLDHILCLIEEKGLDNFEQNMVLVFEEQQTYLKEQKRMTFARIINCKTPIKDIFTNPVFYVLWLLSFVIYNCLPYENHKQLLSDLDVLPIALPVLSYVISGIYFFSSKNKATSTFGAFFSICWILMFYIYFGIHFMRKLDSLPSLALLSGFTAVSMMLYYLFFYYKNKNEKKFTTLLNA